jgi:flagellar L-ring protein precursor FlgH
MSADSLKKFFRFISVVLWLLLAGCATQQVATQPEYMPPPVPVKPEVRTQYTGSIYNDSNNRFLFEDVKARRAGDLITVILEEKTDASKSASTSTNKDSNVNVLSPTLMGLPVTYNGNLVLQNEINSGSSFTGKGDSAQSNSLTGNITVTVVDVQPNGNLVVSGEKQLTLNQGSEVVKISGIVRAIDVTPANTVKSNQIANAKITYAGNGAISDSNRAGWLTRFFNSGLWPF